MHTEHSDKDFTEKKANYIPMIVIAAVLAFLAWTLLHNFDGKGNMWAGNTSTSEGHDGHESQESGMEKKATSVTINPAALGKLNTITGNFVYNTGVTKELVLPDGVKLSVGATSSEAKLYAFLSDAKMVVDSLDKIKGWISLDRLYFETSKSILMASSQTQLKNIAAILKAYPNVALKMGGYTDNTGSADSNLKLSESRAKSAMASLVAAGTSASRLEAEGYGQEHSIADNATTEGRALNRRIDVRVTKK